MEFRQLRYFCAVADEGNLTRAAEWLGLRSPSLSQQIRSLERELGAPLFERSAAGMALTAAGEALLPEARAALAAAERGARAVASAVVDVRPLTVGVPPGVPPDLPERLRTAARDLGAEVVFEDVATDGQLPRLRAGGLDFGVLALPVDGTGLDVRTVRDEPLGVLMTRGHPLAALDGIGWADLEGQELLWFPRELASGYHDAVLAACRAAGWRPALRTATARRAITRAELASGDPVVALRPRWDAAGEPGLAWRPLTAEGAPRLRYGLARPGDAPHPLLPGLARHLAR
ncbi:MULTISPECIES: LysR family transcriptional regulator [Actinomadura]|uniref:LysR family transcriptional regulator n=1 Tax=Actinomadura yumaensis TaxID=111807 RepID=A0ABW2CF40_9ACTN|nr:LysR family transcriptional regulator [Actinomadura sp. J1-007]MWK38176.1 LysR family transcriptional regulator [Actinomadura sp. J1-007]